MSTSIQNYQSSSGLQNNNNAAGTQNISVVNSFNTAVSHPFKTLVDAVAGVGASHNAEQQHSRGECLPETREEVIRIIWEWILAKGKELPICWLSGTAGVGKTAIAITIAKKCEREGRLVSSFFFFRSDPRRNNPSALVHIIAHGLVVNNPSYRVSINQRISNDPTILDARIEEQFRELVVNPCRRQTSPSQKTPNPSSRQKKSGRARKSEGKRSLAEKEDPDRQGSPNQPGIPNLVIIDGLDECGDEQAQKRILSMIQSAFHDSPHFPLRFLICSRPEAWLQEAFTTNHLSRLSKCILLNDEFRPAKDILKYYRHQFREIVSSPKYNQVQFPVPWPKEEDLETLVDKSCSQFIYAATVSRFIVHDDEHPMDQLCLILESAPSSQPGASSPYEALDTLYNIILTANRNHDKVRPILAAILVLTLSKKQLYLEPTPASIELLLGLPSGQVALRLRGMHSVLNIRGRDDVISIHHTSFREYLLDQTRSCHFHIDIDSQKYVLVRQWLQNLTTSKVRKYRYEGIYPLFHSLASTEPVFACIDSSSQLYSRRSLGFFLGWIRLCTSIPQPSRDLLYDLWNVDLAFTSMRIEYNDWDGEFKKLVRWVESYDGPRIYENMDKHKVAETQLKVSKNARLKPDSHPSCDNGQSEVKAHNCKMAEEEEGLDLVERLFHKFKNRPSCFHLVCPRGVPPREDVIHYIVSNTVGCPFTVAQVESKPSDVDDVRLTDCCCDLSGGSNSSDPGHLAYQEACRQLVKAYVSCFEELAQSSLKDSNTIGDLGNCFSNMVFSSLLKHCRLDQELLLLCQTFFGLVKGCLKMKIDSGFGKEGRKNILGWIKTFPDEFAEEGKALKVQVRTLPWKQWVENVGGSWDDLNDLNDSFSVLKR
ncbi:hypothetical protein PQX77_021424 [Marasmius sp. AFHP31]|nr:hypothetical protein PQX77_021424 [Marasmius sp. AFHP31]